MVDIQRRAVLRSLSKATSSTSARSPHVYQSKLADASEDSEAFFSALASPSPATSTVSSTGSSSSSAPSSTSSAAAHSPYAFNHGALLSMQHVDDDDSLFAAYAAEAQPQDLDDPLRAHAWELYYTPAPLPTPVTPSSVAAVSSATAPAASASGSATLAISTSSAPVSTSASASTPSSTTGRSVTAPRARQGVKRPLDRPSPSPLPSPTTSVASSMLAMRHTAADASTAARASSGRTTSTTVGRRAAGSTVASKKAASASAVASAVASPLSSSSSSDAEPPAKKTKVSRERQLKINAASRRCRKKQKLELQFLRTHVVELQSALKDQLGVLRGAAGQQQRLVRLATILDDSIRQVDDMSSGGRPGTPKNALFSDAELQQLKLAAAQALADAQADVDEEDQAAPAVQPATVTPRGADGTSVRELDPMTGYALSDERRQTLLNIASFVRNNMSLESQSFSPEVISCLPIEMDGWQLRLAITEKNYTIHNCKFFPCDVQDLYDFCWETNVSSKTSVKQGANDYCVVTPLAADVAHVYSKTIGKWSLSVHGVANVSYNSLVCRSFNAESRRAMICQQSVLEDRDFEDESTIPWLFKRWVVFQPRVVDGVHGTFVEAYRTASYATGRLIYKEDNTYDSFCEHLIRRYAESNSLLERMMARDPRFRAVAARDTLHRGDAALLEQEETTSDRMVKDLLLF